MFAKQKKALQDCLIKLMVSYIEKKKNIPLSYFAQLLIESRFCKTDPSFISDILEGELLNFVDIGARGGLENDFIKYRHLLNLFLCEADPDEALRLKNIDPEAIVFDSIIGSDVAGPQKLNIGSRAGTSSQYEVDLSYLDFYCSGKIDRFISSHSVERSTNTIENLLRGHVDSIDYLKIDTQGSELEILKGIGKFRPIIIKCEVSYLPLYRNSCMIWDIQEYLFGLGYIMFHQSVVMRNAPKRHNSKAPFSKAVVPMHGDAYFMPDWTKWDTIIGNRLNKFKALSEIFCLEDVYEYSISRKIV